MSHGPIGRPPCRGHVRRTVDETHDVSTHDSDHGPVSASGLIPEIGRHARRTSTRAVDMLRPRFPPGRTSPHVARKALRQQGRLAARRRFGRQRRRLVDREFDPWGRRLGGHAAEHSRRRHLGLGGGRHVHGRRGIRLGEFASRQRKVGYRARAKGNRRRQGRRDRRVDANLRRAGAGRGSRSASRAAIDGEGCRWERTRATNSAFRTPCRPVRSRPP